MVTDTSATPHGEAYLNESILLDTTGAWSWLGVVVAARGRQAAALREDLADEGLGRFAEKRLRLCSDRFTNARRIGALEYRDDPDANEFFLAETFEIKDFLTVDPQSKWHKLDLASDVLANFLAVPEADPRQPFPLLHPCHLVHTIELHSVALPPAVVQQQSLESEFLHFTRLRKTLAGYWTMKWTLSTLANAVPPESFDEHRRMIRKIRAQSAWSILAPTGDRRPHKRGDFGRLPVSWDPAFSAPATPPPRPRPERAPKSADAQVNEAALLPPATSVQPPARKLVRRKSNRKRGKKVRARRWSVLAACGLALILIVIMAWAAKNADRWNVFKMRPQVPVPTVNP